MYLFVAGFSWRSVSVPICVFELSAFKHIKNATIITHAAQLTANSAANFIGLTHLCTMRDTILIKFTPYTRQSQAMSKLLSMRRKNESISRTENVDEPIEVMNAFARQNNRAKYDGKRRASLLWTRTATQWNVVDTENVATSGQKNLYKKCIQIFILR